MARLSSDQWLDIRTQWEASPTQGLAWLVRANGGPWDVTEEAVRQRRKNEGWTKRGSLGSVVEKAHLAADAAAGRNPDHGFGEDELGGQVGGPESGGNSGPHDRPGGPELGSSGTGTGAGDEAAAGGSADAERSEKAEKSAVELRAALIERHREEWKHSRARLYAAINEAKKARGFDSAKFAKIISETLTLIQAGERKAWGLDAQNLPLKDMSDEDLERVASGRMPA